jgi:hypothetical protein
MELFLHKLAPNCLSQGPDLPLLLVILMLESLVALQELPVHGFCCVVHFKTGCSFDIELASQLHVAKLSALTRSVSPLLACVLV